METARLDDVTLWPAPSIVIPSVLTSRQICPLVERSAASWTSWETGPQLEIICTAPAGLTDKTLNANAPGNAQPFSRLDRLLPVLVISSPILDIWAAKMQQACHYEDVRR